jgi:hypothetical protein
MSGPVVQLTFEGEKLVNVIDSNDRQHKVADLVAGGYLSFADRMILDQLGKRVAAMNAQQLLERDL